MKKLFASCFTGLLLIGSLIGCGKWDPQPPPVTLTAIAVTPANPSIPMGLTQQFTATGVYSDGTSALLTSSVTWTSATPARATIVGTTGLATGVTAGTSVITASNGTLSGTTTLTVTAATLTSITVTPANPSIPNGLTRQFIATGNYSDGTAQVLTASAVWTSATLTVATMNANGTVASGLATGIAVGTSVIRATSGAISGTTVLTVTAATLTSITLTPLLPSIPKGLTQQFTATGHYSDGTVQFITSTAVWTSATLTVATMNANGTVASGLATGLAVGSSVITATSGAISGNTTLTVTAATLSSITVTPANPTIPKGLTQQFIATGLYSDLTTQILTTSAIWSSGTLTVATMNPSGQLTSGLATGLAAGTSVITATSGSVSGNTTLTVTPATLISLVVTPSNPTIAVAATQQFVATGTYSDLTTQILTTVPTTIWSSGTLTVATMNANGQITSGLATGVAAGNSIITATSGLISGNTLLTVTALVPPPPNQLGSASAYGIMATSAITNTGFTVINGDVSLEPGSSMTGFPPGIVNGTININNTLSAQARADLLVGYNYYKTLPPGVTIGAGADLGALYPTGIPPGTYTSGSTMLVATPLVLDGGGDANAVWVFQIGSSLTTTANVTLTGSAQAKNVFWVNTLDGTIGVGSTFSGTIISGRDVTGKTGATINGRILAGATLAGTSALDTNTVNVPAP